ncbi:hypothetical protein P4O66_007166, partial [Electrophorus voltai]
TIQVHQLVKKPKHCHSVASLLCTITEQEKEFNIVSIAWIKDSGTLCKEPNQYTTATDHRIYCHYEPLKHLNLTINNLTETDNGSYTCKLMSNSKHMIENFTLNLTVCSPENEPRKDPRRNKVATSGG